MNKGTLGYPRPTPAPAGGGSLASGAKSRRGTDVGTPQTVTGGTTATILNDLMDWSSLEGVGITWNTVSHRFDLAAPGLYVVSGEVGLDSNALTTGDAALRITGTTSPLPRTPNTPYGSGTDMRIFVNCCAWFESQIGMDLFSSETVDVTYADLLVHHITIA